jgi:hypothetical protein
MSKTSSALLTEGFLIIVLTFFAFSSCYYYEYGACIFYGIPTSYITIELTRNIPIAFVVFMLLYFATVGDSYLIDLLDSKASKRMRILTLILIISYATQLIYLNWNVIKLVTNFYLLSTFLLGAAIWGLQPSSSVETINESKSNIAKLIYTEFGKRISNFLMILSLTLFALSMVGYISARMQKTYYTKNNRKWVLLKQYGSAKIYGILNADTLVRGKIIIEENTSNTDTIEVVKLPKLVATEENKWRMLE